MNIFDALENGKNHFPEKEAILFAGESIVYHDLHARSCRLSAALKEVGDLHPGDRVALFLPNRPEFIVSYFAVVRLGAIAVSLNVMLKRGEVKLILNDCAAKLLITTSQLLDQVPEPSEIPSVKKVLCTDKSERVGVLELDSLPTLADAKAAA